jgi:hypothetical protein
MTKKELEVILSGIRHAQRNIEMLGFENFPYGMAEDRYIQIMYYRLNDMCCLLSDKIVKMKS